MSSEGIEFFVPGRICLFGEHSDWAGGYRRVNSALDPGQCIICGTNQGIHARVRAGGDRFIFNSFDHRGESIHLDEPMEPSRLSILAKAGGFWSYAAGVAFQAIAHYRVAGIQIDTIAADLPIQKGLSSSAATCVLVARAFNKAYDLKLTIQGEMDLAYRGEISTPSRCGRMDQGCAYGSTPIRMLFDGDTLEVDELEVGADFYFVIVDLHAKKDTVKILAALNKAYPFAEAGWAKAAQAYLGKENVAFIARARMAMLDGDAETLGRLMTETQRRFDECLGPLCPEELSAPILHSLLGEPSIQPYIYGGKGVGSQGDGSAQFICRDKTSQRELMSTLSALGYKSLPLTIPKTRKVRKAVITAAGFGTRLFPMTSIVRKEFLPVVDAKGRMMPLILANVEEVLDAGIEHVAIIVQEGDQSLFEKFFRQEMSQKQYQALSLAARRESERIRSIGSKITYIVQAEQSGLGHAVALARSWVGQNPFLLLLGDHLFVNKGLERCAKQLVDRYTDDGASLIGIQVTSEDEVGRFGAVAGEWMSNPSGCEPDLLKISSFKEKPDIEYAREHLVVDGLPPESFLTVFGLYILSPGLLEELDRRACKTDRSGELQLTDALDYMLSKEDFYGLRIQGEKVDIGVPAGYLTGINLYAEASIALTEKETLT